MTDSSLLHFICAKCDAHLTVEAGSSGITGACPACGKEITSPGAIIAKPDLPQRPSKPAQAAALNAPLGDPAVNPRTGVTKEEEEALEFAAIVKLIILAVLAGALAVGFGIYFQDQIWQWIDAAFAGES